MTRQGGHVPICNIVCAVQKSLCNTSQSLPKRYLHLHLQVRLGREGSLKVPFFPSPTSCVIVCLFVSNYYNGGVASVCVITLLKVTENFFSIGVVFIPTQYPQSGSDIYSAYSSPACLTVLPMDLSIHTLLGLSASVQFIVPISLMCFPISPFVQLIYALFKLKSFLTS